MRGFFYNRCLNFQSVICISFYHPTDTECNCFPRASAIGRIFMTYQEFKENVTTVIQNRLGSNVKVTIQEIIKNNDTHYDGLTILSNQLNISPTIYLNFYFKQYLKGRSLEEICHDILSVYEENKPSGNIDISFFTNYEQVKKRIVFKLINYEQNKNLLQKIPHIKILDLAIIFNCLVDADETGNATILIYNQHLSLWNITKDDLYHLAMKNTPALLTYELRDMSDVLIELMAGVPCNSMKEEFEYMVPMYVLSNKSKLNGSGCIFYHNLLHNLCEKLECDLYILPSSIHEVLILATDENDRQNLDHYTAMVKEVNASQLQDEEILSDHAYYYCRHSHLLTMPQPVCTS